MNKFETLLNDAIESCKRLNSELAERLKFEESLMQVIEEKDKEISELKIKLTTKTDEETPLKEYLEKIENDNITNNYITNGIVK